MDSSPTSSPSNVKPAHRRRRLANAGSTLLAEGEPQVWFTSGALVVALAMIVGLLALVFWLGSTTFVAKPLVQVELLDGSKHLGEVFREEWVPLTSELIFREPPAIQRQVIARLLRPDEQAAWRALPDEITAHAATLRREQADVDVRLAAAQSKLSRLQAVRGPAPDTPAARAEWIRSDSSAENMERTSQLVETLGSRQEALKRQIAIAEQTAAKLRQQSDANPLEALLSLDEDVQIAVVDALLAHVARQVGQPQLLVRRRLLRTGNFDVTQTHFTWVADYLVKHDGETRPQWALLVERQKDGNFYGLLDALVVRHPRPVQAEEESLTRPLQWFEQQAALFSTPQQKELLDKAQSQIRDERDKLRGAKTREFMQGFAATSAERGSLAAVTASGRQIALDPLQPDQIEAADPVVSIQESYVEPAAAWHQFEIRHAEAMSLRNSQELRDRSAADRKHQLLEDSRLQCREADVRLADERSESAGKLSVLELASRLAAGDQAEAQWKRQLQTAEEMRKALETRFGPQSPAAEAAALVATQQIASSQRRQEKFASETAAAQRQLAAEPLFAQQAVSNFRNAERAAAGASATVSTETDKYPAYELRLKTAQGKVRSLPLEDVVRATASNRLTAWQRAKVYVDRWWEFLTAEPRNGNSEGGVFPAIFGTVVMTLLMTLAVVPFGVLAALYLREYAKAGPIVSVIRISINNLAGVPSIVFGVFGLGFFCYVVGAYIDGGPKQAQFSVLPKGQWIVLAVLAAVVCVLAFTANLFGLAARKAEATRRQRVLRASGGVLWVAASLLLVYLLATTPLFSGLYRAHAPSPKFGTGGLLWASLTLALLTLPVVIVATEEALAAVPNSMREGSYGCGASRWQTIRRVVLPQALPGIMTGMILAMARGAGEVAPLMLVGAVHSASALPIDTDFPFVHAQRSFMHLGYQIYYLGFQSQNSQAAVPMVFTTTLLLIVIVAALNLMAMWLRARLRKRFQHGQF